MSTYVIGDLQGCFDTLQALLRRVNFDYKRDTLWFVGDLVNRGAGSLACLRYVKSLGRRARVVLGNHDLHLLAVAEGFAKAGKLDTLGPILEADDREELLIWLRQQPLLYVEGDAAMVHAGLMPEWSWEKSRRLAQEVERALRGPRFRRTLAAMYGDQPDHWRDDLTGAARLRFIINTMTRMRALDGEGRHQIKYKSGLADMPQELRPWFACPTVRRSTRTLYTGHWSAIGYLQHDRVVALDTGCIWGGALTAVRLDDHKRFTQPSVEAGKPKDPLAAKGD
jgi:bis(5'-nucleosyl)-tetraphosphatase (symmetrical)